MISTEIRSDGNKVEQLKWDEVTTANNDIVKVATSGKINFKHLTPNQIEVRPTGTTPKGQCTLLLYIDSRCASNILDETVGAFNWSIEYKPIGDKVFGRLSIYDEVRNIWVVKEDTGNASEFESDKGLSSDILKRCLARWGCDYLYTAPKIKIQCPNTYYFNDKMTMSFSVKSIDYVGKHISQLTIADRFDNVVFDWTINQTSVPVYNSDNAKHYMVPETHREVKISETMSNEEQLIAFRDAMRGKCDDKTLSDFFNFYMRVDNKHNNGRSVAANWEGYFNPEDRFSFWLNKKNNTNKYGYNG
ncbi:MAG: hypothetical protein IKV83_08630 [Muribaculaceae bacterium]|nr:hypothetical protein [Muribaculaceae bacterium]